MATLTVKAYIIVSLVLCITLLFAYLDFKFTLVPRFSKHTGDVSEAIFIRKYDVIYQPSTRLTKQILLWTGYFDSPEEWSVLMNNYLSGCPNPCSVTTNRDHLAMSDVVMFHDTNIDYKNLPGMRILRQPWMLFTMEPTALVKKNYKWFHKVFNWTLSYRNYSTFLGGYGDFRLKTDIENMEPVSLKNKTKSMFAVISNCHDAGRRFKLIKEISKYFDVDQYGRCSRNKCVGNHGPCLPKEQLDQYKFKLAFENSNCRHYVTEKYWQTLESNSSFIPIVNWVKGQTHPHVIPGSYINIYDFPSMEEFVKHIKEIGSNETLFQQYFQWRSTYRLKGSDMYCKVCNALHQPYQAQDYDDLDGWFKDDTCTKYSLSGMTGRWIERRIFNIMNH